MCHMAMMNLYTFTTSWVFKIIQQSFFTMTCGILTVLGDPTYVWPIEHVKSMSTNASIRGYAYAAKFVLYDCQYVWNGCKLPCRTLND
jgi:hypothetical protein